MTNNTERVTPDTPKDFCPYCSKELNGHIVELDGKLMHYHCANEKYIETRGEEGCLTPQELQELMP